MTKNIQDLSVSLEKLLGIIVSLPLIGLVFSVVWSLYFDFEASTATHCHVTNYLPSVSAAIALTPQAYVWRCCIALHSAPRYIIVSTCWMLFKKQTCNDQKLLSPLKGVLVFITCSANFVELSALLGLTFISSTENPDVHEACFASFMVGALTCMITACLLNSITVVNSDDEKRAARLMKWALIINVSAFLFSLYFFFRHNSYCEPGVYSLFAFCEYIVIVTNMAYHYYGALYHFQDCSLCLSDNGKQR